MTKQNRAKTKGQIDQNHGKTACIAMLVIALAIAAILAYRYSASSRLDLRLIAATAKSSGANHSPIAENASSPMDGDGLFEPTVPNVSPAPAKPPKGMVWIPVGVFSMGAQNSTDMDEVGMKATADSRPVHRVYVDGFFMDRTGVQAIAEAPMANVSRLWSFHRTSKASLA